MKAREPGQVRKEAALSGPLQARWERRSGVGSDGRASDGLLERGCTIRLFRGGRAAISPAAPRRSAGPLLRGAVQRLLLALVELDVARDAGQPQRRVGRGRGRDHQTKALAARLELGAQLVDELDLGAVEVGHVGQVENQRVRLVGDGLRQRLVERADVRLVDLAAQPGDGAGVMPGELDVCQPAHPSLRRIRISAPSSPWVTYTASIAASMIDSPRPRFVPRGWRQRPWSRTTIVTSPSRSTASTSNTAGPGEYACSIALAHASLAAIVTSAIVASSARRACSQRRRLRRNSASTLASAGRRRRSSSGISSRRTATSATSSRSRWRGRTPTASWQASSALVAGATSATRSSSVSSSGTCGTSTRPSVYRSSTSSAASSNSTASWRRYRTAPSGAAGSTSTSRAWPPPITTGGRWPALASLTVPVSGSS